MWRRSEKPLAARALVLIRSFTSRLGVALEVVSLRPGAFITALRLVRRRLVTSGSTARAPLSNRVVPAGPWIGGYASSLKRSQAVCWLGSQEKLEEERPNISQPR